MKKGIFILGLFLVFCFVIFSTSSEEVTEEVEDRGIFVSYIELANYLKGKGEDEGKKAITEMVSNVYDLGFNMILLQVRTFSDAIYESQVYPWSEVVSGQEGVSPGYDVLETFLDVCHKKDIRLFAWINPYRIRGDEDISDISEENPAYRYLNTDVVAVSGGVYYNPAKEEVRNLIVSGVEEIVKHYNVDGVLFDDYFYPNDEIDLADYEAYQKEHPDVSLSQFRLDQVNDLIKRVYSVCHEYDVLFAVSPDGNIDNNYQSHYADVRLWGSEEGYMDYLMPQIYYGFYNETKAFTSVLDEWESLASHVSLLPVLAFYKVGAVDTFAKSGSLEWMEHDDIIMREVILTRNIKQYQGFSLFRYDYLFNADLNTEMTSAEIKNMKKVLK